jgi:integrase
MKPGGVHKIVIDATTVIGAARVPWNKDNLTGQKPPLKLKEIWAIRIRLQLAARTRDLAMFNLAIDSKLRARELTKLRARDICLGQRVTSRDAIMQQETRRPVQFEITALTRDSVKAWIKLARLSPSDFLFLSFDASIRPPGASLDRVYRARRYGIQDAHRAPNKSVADLPALKTCS